MSVRRAVTWNLVARAWGLLAAPVSVFIITTWLTEQEQGYYYTFYSLIAMQTFLELGLSGVIVTIASHEAAHVTLLPKTPLEGEVAHIERFLCLGQLVTRWYALIAILFCLGVGSAGLWVLGQHVDTVVWRPAWGLLLVAAAVQILLLPFIAMLEGANRVADVNRARTMGGLAQSLTLWSGIMLGAGVLSAALALFANVLTQCFMLLSAYWPFAQQTRRYSGAQHIHWGEEIWPLQWRMALSGIANYFTFSIYTPVAFSHWGAIAAGKVGLTLQIAWTINAISSSWMQAQQPYFGALVASKQWQQLRITFVRTLRTSLVVASGGAILALAAVWMLSYLRWPQAERFFTLSWIIILLVGVVAQQLTQCWSGFVRSHKQEPFAVLAVVIGVINIFGVYLCTWFGQPEHVVLVYTLCFAGVVAPVVGKVFWKYWQNMKRKIVCNVESATEHV